MEQELNELKLLSIPEAAGILSVGRDTLKYLIAKGLIGFIPVGKSKKIPYKELARFIDENLVTEKAEYKSSISDNDLKKFFGLQGTAKSLNGSELLNNIIRK